VASTRSRIPGALSLSLFLSISSGAAQPACALDAGELAGGALAAALAIAAIQDAGTAPAPSPAPARTASVAEAVFSSYPLADRKRIQDTLSELALYRSDIDGLWGPGTEAAVKAYARTAGMSDALATPSGAHRVFTAITRAFAGD